MTTHVTRGRRRLLTGTATGALVLGALVATPAPATATQGGGDRAEKAPVGKLMTVRNERQLRRAVLKANHRDGIDRIRLAADITFDPSRPTGGGALKGDLDVTDDLRVFGRHQIDANGVDRVFDVRPETSLRLTGLWLVDGAPAEGESGGAVRSQGTVRFKGGAVVGGSATGTGASGGAFMNDGGVLRVIGARLLRNDAVRAGGAIEAFAGRTVVRGTLMKQNTAGAEPGNGGALHLTDAGTVTVTGSKVVRNTASAEGGGLWNSAVGTFRVRDTLLHHNRAAGAAADNGGGALFNDGGTMTVSDSTIRRNRATGEAGSGGGILNNLGTLEVTGSTLEANDASRAGGGIEANVGTTTVTGSVLSGNSTGAAPGNGGGLHLTGAGTVAVEGSQVLDNTAAAEGGGLWNSATGEMDVSDSVLRRNVAAGAAADQGGGGLFNDGGALTVADSTVADNDATGAAGSGGGILNNLGTLTVTGSTLSGNTAVRAGGGLEANVGTTTLLDVVMTGNDTGSNPGNGGALHLTGAGTVSWTDGEATGNTATNEGGGLWNSATGTMTVAGVTIEGNSAPEGPDVYNDGGTFTVDGTPVPPPGG
ncbi:hypothetical protein GCM10009623_11950 [Nocardioides aestuarii]|uniref:Right-handed parallel beta-helix repeat-containing protein n=1 Tax=Nocardioides aestuarii TaxID=252231 RepID=A0ABW4TIB0_9ACTN